MACLARSALSCALACALWGCTGIPAGLEPVTGFECERYLGKWYEIARLDHSFERGLTRVSAEYAVRPEGGLTVINRGYDPAAKEWREAHGVAYFRGEETVGSLKVTFFWPFYGGYHIIALDKEHYRYALIVGPSRAYLWILCREPTLEPAALAALVDRAKSGGFETEKLIYVDQRDVP